MVEIEIPRNMLPFELYHCPCLKNINLLNYISTPLKEWLIEKDVNEYSLTFNKILIETIYNEDEYLYENMLFNPGVRFAIQYIPAINIDMKLDMTDELAVEYFLMFGHI